MQRMQHTQHTQQLNARRDAEARGSLWPFPEGWYFVATRAELRKAGGLIGQTWCGAQIVAWCDAQGTVCVADAFCPHLGSHLGPQAGGAVVDGCLVCPFHGFAYDASGACVSTPHAPPPKAHLKVYATDERDGLIFAWWSSAGRAPQWRIGARAADDAQWTQPALCRLRGAGHVQDAAENAVDLAHLRAVHGYGNVRQTLPVAIDGAHLKVGFDFTISERLLGVGIELAVSAVVDVFGLGYSQVDIRETRYGLHRRLLVLAVPVDGQAMDIVLACRMANRAERWPFGLGLLPRAVRGWLMTRAALLAEAGYVRQDQVIWARKRYRPHPTLAASDGEIPAYRRYCEQFYFGCK